MNLVNKPLSELRPGDQWLLLRNGYPVLTRVETKPFPYIGDKDLAAVGFLEIGCCIETGLRSDHHSVVGLPDCTVLVAE